VEGEGCKFSPLYTSTLLVDRVSEKFFYSIFSYRHSSVRNNLKLSTNGRAKTIVGKLNGSSFITGEEFFSIISIVSSSK
jgi:hypothetical protein